MNLHWHKASIRYFFWVCLTYLSLIAVPLSLAQAQDETSEPALVIVHIEGLSGQILNNTKSFLSLYEYHQKKAPGEARVRYLHQQAHRELRRALSPFGYYRFTVESELEKKENNWHALYNIELNDPIAITDIQIHIEGDGEQDASFQRFIEKAPVQLGKPLLHSDYEATKSALRTHASNRGYYEAQFTKHELRIDVERYEASVHLTLLTGPRYRYGTIHIAEGHLDKNVMQRFIGFKEGDFVSANDLLNLQIGLSNSNYFSRVEVQPHWQESTDDYQVPISIDYEPNKRTHYQAGLGYGTDTGPRMKLEENRRWINSKGHRLNTQIQASEIIQSVGASYIIPGSQPQSDLYMLRALWSDEKTDTVHSEKLIYGASWQSERERTQRILSLDWQEERDRLDGDIRRTQYLIQTVQWTRVNTPNRLNVHHGWRFSLTLRGASEAVLSDSHFLQTIANGKYVFSPSPKVRLLVQGEVGTLITNNYPKVPTSLRFYAGGDRSVRGYAYRSISPRNTLGEVEGARNLIQGSLEIDYEVKPNFRVATFIDTGNTFNDVKDPFKIGAGFGVRWQTPIGPIRIDLAHGFSEPGDTIRLHLTIGPDL